MSAAQNANHQYPGDTRDLLWTGGWDSTFRLLAALLLEDATVQPHYIADPGRTSTGAELKAMERIRDAIAAAHPAAAAHLLPLRFTDRADIPRIGITERRFESLAARGPLGSQYEWLARYAASVGLVDLELSIHCDDKAHDYLDGHVEPIRTRSSTVYRLKAEDAKNDLALFERFTFPVFDLTKLDMQRMASDKGFLDVLDMSWFCHSPLGDVPCGVCGPCFDAVREGVGHRLPRSSRLRNRLYRVVPWRKIASKVRQIAGVERPRPTTRTTGDVGLVQGNAARPLPHGDGGVH